MAHVQADVLGFQIMFTAEEAEQLRTGAVRIIDLVTDDQVRQYVANLASVKVGEANEGFGVLLRHDWSDAPISIAPLPPPSVPRQRRNTQQ